MTTEQIQGGGSMTVPQMIIPQIIYLDFDGAETQYKNSVLGLNIDVTVEVCPEGVDGVFPPCDALWLVKEKVHAPSG